MGLASCGGGTNADAIATCQGVHLAVRLRPSRRARAVARGATGADLLDAQRQMALVVADAAMANSEDGSYDALMTLVQAGPGVPFPTSSPALTDVCKTIDSPTNYL